VQLENDPARAPGVHRQASTVRRMRPRRHLSVVPGTSPTVTKIAPLSPSVAPCTVSQSVYSGPTNQVPATWFAGDAGIRRLALQSDGPVRRGRCRVFDFVPEAIRLRHGRPRTR